VEQRRQRHRSRGAWAALASGINDAGQVAGGSSNFVGPVVWSSDGSVNDLGNPPGSIDNIVGTGGINDAGQ
jgi:hypothetical protein